MKAKSNSLMKRFLLAISIVTCCLLLFIPNEDVFAATRSGTTGKQVQESAERAKETIDRLSSRPLSDIESYEVMLIDENTGIRLGVYYHPYPDEFLSDEYFADGSHHRASYLGDMLLITKNDDALHEQGTCDACDRLREKMGSGEIQCIYRISISPDNSMAESKKENVRIELPKDGEQTQEATSVLACDNGNLIEFENLSEKEGYVVLPRYESIFAMTNNRLDSAASAEGNMSTSQSQASRPELLEDAHAYTPDDDDEDEDESLLGLFILVGALACALIALVVTGRLSARNKN